MKLRIRGDSLRLRLTRNEVAQLAAEGRVVESIRFGTGAHEELIYSLEALPDVEGITSQYEHGRIAVRLPAEVAKRWAESEQVSLEAKQTLTVGRELKLLIEKDFACLVGRAPEEDADAFPHPSAGALTC